MIARGVALLVIGLAAGLGELISRMGVPPLSVPAMLPLLPVATGLALYAESRKDTP